jgi:hypothetical protein
MRKSLFVLAVALTAITSVIVINAQHQNDGRQAHAAGLTSDALFVHNVCAEYPGVDGATSGHHVPAEVVSALELTDAQQAELNRKAADACAAMARVHEEMMSVLTPEQQEKMQAFHNAHSASHDGGGALRMHNAVMSWMKKIHAGLAPGL